MVALRMHAVGLVLMPVWAEAATPWNSTDMTYKYTADKAMQAKRQSELHTFSANFSTYESWLSGNKTTLKTMKEEKGRAQSDNSPIAKQISQTMKDLHQAEEDMAHKLQVLNEATENVTETTASEQQATAALHAAQTAKDTATAANNTAKLELARAQDNLQQKVICCPGEVESAKTNVDLKKKALVNANATLSEAETVLTEKKKALRLATANYHEAVRALALDKTAYQDAVGVVNSTTHHLRELNQSDATPQMIIRGLTAAVEKQEHTVQFLTDMSNAIHDAVIAMQRAYDNISAVVKKDVKCISRLQTGETTLAMGTLQFKKAADAYEAAPQGPIQDGLKPALWELKDNEDVANHSLWKVQEDCAPQNITLREEPPQPDCPVDTTGTCRWFNCHGSRHAECSPDYKCLCSAGTCAINGVCQDRGSPVLLVSPSTELRAEPAAAGTVLLAAATLTVTVLLVMRRRHTLDTREIHMPKSVLG